MPISPSEFEVVDEGKGPNWEDFEPVPDPKALAFGVSESIAEPARLMGVIRNPAVGLSAEMGRDLAQRLREREATRQMGRFSLDPAAMAGVLPEEQVQATKDIIQKPVEFGFQQAHEALAPFASDVIRRSGIDPSSTPENIINLPRVTAESVQQQGEAGRGSLTPTSELLGLAMRHAPGIVAGLANLQNRTIESFAQPEQAGLILASGGEAVFAKVASLLFASDQFASLPDQIKEAVKVLRDPNASTADKVEAMGKPGVGAIFGAMMAKHGITPGPGAQPPLLPADRELMAMAARPGGITGKDLQLPQRIPATMRAPLTPGLVAPELPQYSRLEIPEGPSDPRVQEIRDKGLKEINQILAAFPELKGRREDARALRNDAFPEMRKEADATRIQREQEHIGAAPGAEVQGEPTEVRPGAGEPDRDSGGVLRGEEGQAPVSPQVIEKADEDFFQKQLGEIQGRIAKQINDEIVKTVQEKGWAALDESDRRHMTPDQRKAYQAWVDAGKPEGGGKIKPEEPPPTAGEPVPVPPKPPTPAPGEAPAAPTAAAPEPGSLEHIKGQSAADFFKTAQGWQKEAMAGKGVTVQERAEAAARAKPDLAAWQAAYDEAAKDAERIKKEIAADPSKMMERQEEMMGAGQKTQFFSEGIKEIQKTKPAEGFDMGAASKEAKANYDKAIKAAEGSEAVEMTSPSFPGLRVLITKDPSEPGKWRATRVDEKGPSGHTVYDSKEKAIADYTGGHGMGAAFGWDFTVSEARKPTAAAAPAEPKGPEFSKAEEEDLAAAWRSAKDASELSPLHQSMFRVKRAKTAFRELGKWAEQKDANARARWQAAKAELEAASAEYAKQKEIAKQAKVPVAETKPAISATPPADVESMLKAEVPDVTEQKARVKAVETRTRELKKELDSLTPEIKELEKKIKYQRGSVYQRSKIKQGAKGSDVARYRELTRKQDELGNQIRTLEEATRKDRDEIDAAESAKIIADKDRPLLQRLDHAARRPGASTELIKARDAETYRLLKEKYPDITDAEMTRLAPEVQREAHFGGDFMQRIPAVRNLRQAALDAAANAPDAPSHLFPQELRDKIDRMRESKTIGAKELEDLKKEIKNTSTKIREDLAAQEKKAAEEKAAEEAKSAQLMAEAQAQADSAKRSGTKGGRSPKEIRTELVSRIKEEIDKIILARNVKVTESPEAPDYIHAESETGLVASGVIETTSAGKFKVRIRAEGQTVDLTFDNRKDAVWAVKAAASSGPGKAIIGIPGDGVFRLNKNGINLLKVMEDARKIDVSAGERTTPYRSQGGAEKPPSSIKTFSDWREAKEYHGLEATDRIYDWSPALRAVAEKVNPEKPEMVTAGDVDEYLKGKKETKATAPGGGIPEFETPGIAEKVVSKLEDAAEKARARLRAQEQKGIGGELGLGTFLTKIPNAIDYATIGAAKLARFGLDKATWAAEMIKEFGKRITPHLDTLFEDSKTLFYRHAEIERNKATPVQQIIGEATGAGRAKVDTIHQIIDTLQSGLKTVRALKDHFTDAPQVSRAEVKLADDFLEADANRIRESLTALVKKELPPSERGIFITAINNATKRSPILTGDPEAMYRHAAEVAARIEEHGVEVQKKDAVNAIKDNVAKALASPTVDLRFKSKIGDMVKDFTFTKPTAATLEKLKSIRDYIRGEEQLGHNVDMPKAILESLELLNKVPIKELPLHVLEAMRDRIAMLEEMGRRTVATRQQRWENEKEAKERELEGEATNPIEKRPEFTQGLVEGPSPTQKVRNFLNRRMDAAALLDKALLPIDALFDLLGDAKGAYKGWLFKHVRNPIDLGFNAAVVMRDRITKPLLDIIEHHKLDDVSGKRIGIYAALQQEGGRERLLAMGATPAELDKIERTLTVGERSAYNAMRKALDELLPPVQKLMHELYNIPVTPVENYFPMPRDWRKVEVEPKTPAEPKFGEERSFDDLSGWKDLYGDYSPMTSKTEQGMTIERLKGAKTAIKIDAFNVFEQHVNDVAYLLSTQRDIKMIAELAKGDLFTEKYGKVGQSMVLNWLDTVARQGKIGGFRRWDTLDALRKNTSAGVIGFRLASQFVHLSNVPLAAERTGVVNYASGLRAAYTQEGRQFLQDNFAETYARGGGEPALAEAMAEGATVFGKQIVPKSWVKTGFAIARYIDQKNSQATVLGMYLRALKEKGIDPATYADIPVDKEAQARALVMARRAVASPLPKDVPMALSRGALTGNNISLGRAMFQFQNIFLDQWSNMRHDLFRAGIVEGNPIKAARMVFALTIMIGAETGIRELSKEAIQSVTGYKPKQERSPTAKVLIEVARRFPFMGQLTAGVLYGETGVPLLDSILQVPKETARAVTAKSIRAGDKAKIRAIAGAAQLGGVPGASQLGEIIEKSQ